MGIFVPLIYAAEVLIRFSFLLGLFTLVTAGVGAFGALNLWLCLYNTTGEWPWTDGYLIIIQSIFLLDPSGRSLGADVLIRRRYRLSHLLG